MTRWHDCPRGNEHFRVKVNMCAIILEVQEMGPVSHSTEEFSFEEKSQLTRNIGMVRSYETGRMEWNLHRKWDGRTDGFSRKRRVEVAN